MEIQLYVSDYATYNESAIGGKWFDLTLFSSAKEFQEAVQKYMQKLDREYPLYGGIREEIMYQDFEGFPENLYSECMGGDRLEQIFEFVEFCNDKNDEEIEVFKLMLENYDIREISKGIDFYKESYQGHYNSFLDFVYETKENDFDTRYDEKVLKDFEPYFDYDEYSKMLKLHYTEINGHIFLDALS